MKISIHHIARSILLPMLMLPLAFSSCDEERFDAAEDGDGYVRLRLTDDLLPIPVSKSGEGIVYCVGFTDNKGRIVCEYPDHTKMPEQIKLKGGDYSIWAYSQNEVEAGFDTPHYAGDTSATILSACLNTPELVCRLANTKVSVTYSDAVRNNFTEHVVTVGNGAENGTVIFTEEETRSAYFKVTGELTWTIRLVNNNGTAFSTSKTIREVKPREHYRLHFDIDESGDPTDGGISVTLVVDDATNDRNHNFDIPLNPGKKGPQIAGGGFDLSSPVEVATGETTACDVTILSETPIDSVGVAHSSAALREMGIPETFSPTHIDEAGAATLRALGIEWELTTARSAAVTAPTSVVLRFGGLLPKLSADNYAFTIAVRDTDGKTAEQTLKINVVQAEEVTMLGVDAWAKFATFKAKWTSAEKPAGAGFEYRKADATEWIAVPEDRLTFGASEYTARVALDSASNYVVRAVTARSQSIPKAFATERADRMPNMNFDDWSYIGNKTWYAGKDLSSSDISNGNYWWDSGNKGANTLKAVNPTSKETEVVVKGNAVKMATTVVMGVMAAGNIYTGQFNKAILSGGTGAEIFFGKPYTCRPLKLTGYYNYHSGSIDKAKAPYESMKGKQDSCHIYVALCDWTEPFTVNTVDGKLRDFSDPGIIALGELKTDRSTDGYEKFTIDIRYRDTVRKPTYIVLVASASKYGDYFTGSTSSVLYLDEMDFIFDPE